MKMIVLCGIPGAGKSTLATTEFKDYIRINQDELKSRDACLKLCNESLAAGKNVIIDRCNQNQRQRSQWIEMAKAYGAGIHCVYLEAGNEFCAKRITKRKDHPTIKNYDLNKSRKIINQFANELTIPSLSEGFDSVLMINVK